MSELPQMTPEQFLKNKSWIGRLILWAGLGAISLSFLDKVLPFISGVLDKAITVTQQLFVLGAFAAVIGALIAIFSHRKLRTAIVDVFAVNIPLFLTRMLTKITPWSFIEAFREKYVEYKAELSATLDSVMGQMQYLKEIIARVKRWMLDSVEKAEGAQELNDEDLIGVYMQTAEDLKGDLAEYEQLKGDLDLAVGWLEKLSRIIDANILKLDAQIQRLRMKYDVTTKIADAFRSAMRFLVSGTDKDLFNMAQDNIVKRIAEDAAYVQRVTQQTQGFFRDFDLKEALQKRKGRERLDRWREELKHLNQQSTVVNRLEQGAGVQTSTTGTAATSSLAALLLKKQ